MTAAAADMEGFLLKLGGGSSVGQNWNRRYFALHGSVLIYGREPPLPAAGIGGVVHVPRGSCTISRRGEGRGGRFEIEIKHSGGDTLVLAAESAYDCDRWAGALAEPQQHQAGAAPSAAAVDDDAEAIAAAERRLAAAGEAHAAAQRDLAAAKELRHAAQQQTADAHAALKLRRALFHWRGRMLRATFDELVAAKSKGFRAGSTSEAVGAEEADSGLINVLDMDL